MIKAKIGLQKLWKKGLDWDQELPEETYQDWVQLFEQMRYLSEVKFERCSTPSGAIGSQHFVFFLMPQMKHLVHAHMLDGN